MNLFRVETKRLIGYFNSIVVYRIKNIYFCLNRSKIYDEMNFNKMYMTSFIQQIIVHLMPVKAIFIDGG